MNPIMIKSEDVLAYLDRLSNKSYKILPMQEEGCETLDVYISSLCREVLGNSEFLTDGSMLEIAGKLNGLDTTIHSELRRDVLSIMNILKRLKGSIN